MRSWLNKTYCTWLLILTSYRNTRAFLIPVKRSLQRRRYVLLARHANGYSYYKNTTMFLAKNELILNAVVLSTFQGQPEISISLFRLFLFIS